MCPPGFLPGTSKIQTVTNQQYQMVRYKIWTELVHYNYRTQTGFSEAVIQFHWTCYDSLLHSSVQAQNHIAVNTYEASKFC